MKRELINSIYIHKLYKKNLHILNNEKRIKLIKNDVSEELISNSVGVISYPYTSTASIAYYLKKPSIFYDPSKKLDNNDLVLAKV